MTTTTDNPYAPPKTDVEEGVDKDGGLSWLERNFQLAGISFFFAALGVGATLAKCSADKDVGDAEKKLPPQSEEVEVVEGTLSQERTPQIHEVTF